MKQSLYGMAMWLATAQASWMPAYAAEDVFNNALGLSSAEAAEATSVIVAWLECDECVAGELEAVLKLGQTAVPTFTEILERGPSPTKREEFRQGLLDNHRTMQEYLKGRPEPRVFPMSEEKYVEVYMANYITLYKVRAALALGQIGGAAARSALKHSLESEESESVRKAVTVALGHAH